MTIYETVDDNAAVERILSEAVESRERCHSC